MRATLAAIAAVVALVIALTGGTTAATAQDDGAQDEPATGTSPEALVDRLVELERQLPPLPPSDIVLDEDSTWGQLQGDFFAALTELELLSDQARALFADADDADGPTADAVSAVARSYLELEEGYAYLAEYEDYDLTRPLDTTENGLATGADEATGLAETGLSMVTTARVRAITGYATLRDDAAADDTEKDLFDAAYRDTERFLDVTRADLREMLSLPTVAVLVATDRFDPPPGEPHATDVTYVCIDRTDYPADDPDPVLALVQLINDGTPISDAIDCPDLDNTNESVTGTGG